MSTPVQSEQTTHLHDDTFSVRRLIAVGLATRLLLDTGIQIFFPFLPVIAAGLGSNVIALGRLVSLRSATGLVAPLFGALADRRGYRTVMRLGLLLAALGYLAVGMSQNLWLAAAGMVLTGLGTFAFVPAIQAYLSARLPYARRARGLGILEYAWALAGIVGLFLVGVLIDAAGWRAPFFILSGGLFVTWLFYQRLPPAQPVTAASAVTAGVEPPARLARLNTFFNLGANQRSAWSTIAAGGLIMFAAMHLFISFGAWLVGEYSLGPAALGRVALILGIADLCGSGLVSLISDRAGKRRSVILGAAVAAVGFLCLPLFNSGIVPAVIGLIWVRFAFEFTLVSNMTLLSEQVPAQRGKVLTLGAAATLLGSTIAGFTGPLAYARSGVWGLGLIPAIALSGAVILMRSLVHEQ
ncbi:MAG TPA: MFS transporter [Anaerolineae bacterium]